MDEREKRAYLRRLPSVEEVLRQLALKDPVSPPPRAVWVDSVRQVLERRRQRILGAEKGEELEETSENLSEILSEVMAMASWRLRPHLRRVINATGVVLHTNLGRALLSKGALDRLLEVGGHYSNLEYDLENGSRGSRHVHVEGLLCQLTGAEAAMVVNNNAAAVLLALNTLAEGKEVIVSRGELVEIGGSFRLPDVMRKAGAQLTEVGTTNRTHLSDYEGAIRSETALLLKVHASNYRILGFTAEVSLVELAVLARRYGLPVMEDLGSGALVDLSRRGLQKEPLVMESIKAGADLVTFSGDKLLGGPQAGIAVGRREYIGRLKGNPLARAVRVDKFTLAALEATLRSYLDEDEVWEEIPALRMLALTQEELRIRAEELVAQVRERARDRLLVSWEEGYSEAGGGSLPLVEIPTIVLGVSSRFMTAEAMEERLRAHDPPVLGRVKGDRILLDLRTVLEGELKELADALIHLASEDP